MAESNLSLVARVRVERDDAKTIPLSEVLTILRLKAAEYNHRAGHPNSRGAKVCKEIEREIQAMEAGQ